MGNCIKCCKPDRDKGSSNNDVNQVVECPCDICVRRRELCPSFDYQPIKWDDIKDIDDVK